jgi:hypothetical protein
VPELDLGGGERGGGERNAEREKEDANHVARSI